MVRFKWAFEKDAEGLRPPLRGRNVLEIQALTPRSVKNVKGGDGSSLEWLKRCGLVWVAVLLRRRVRAEGVPNGWEGSDKKQKEVFCGQE